MNNTVQKIGPVSIFHGDCREVLKTMPDCSIDSVVTDPPYGLSKEPDASEVLRHWLAGDDYVHSGGGFMGKSWDSFVPGPSIWREVYRVLKPGGHICVFGGTRTYDLMVMSIRLAGFEIRDSLHWIYGSGFPKSHSVHKATLKMVESRYGDSRCGCVDTGDGDLILDDNDGHQDAVCWVCSICGLPDKGWLDSLIPLGTAAKPAHEPIVLARKPLIGTVVQNVLAHGTGALNIDETRIGYQNDTDMTSATPQGKVAAKVGALAGGVQNDAERTEFERPELKGRWPANVVFDAEAGALLDAQSGVSKSGQDRPDRGKGGIWSEGDGVPCGPQHGDSGGASRFFAVAEWDPKFDEPFRYVSKPSKREKNSGLEGLPEHSVGSKGNGLSRRCATCSASVIDGCECPDRTFVNPTRANHHPTVKPVALMRWLVKLATPPNGVVLDPFAGSGTTLIACVMEDFSAVGIELTEDYLPLIEGRVSWACEQNTEQSLPFEKNEPLTLWDAGF